MMNGDAQFEVQGSEMTLQSPVHDTAPFSLLQSPSP